MNIRLSAVVATRAAETAATSRTAAAAPAVRLLILSLHLRWWLDDTRSSTHGAILAAIYHAAAAADINPQANQPDCRCRRPPALSS